MLSGAHRTEVDNATIVTTTDVVYRVGARHSDPFDLALIEIGRGHMHIGKACGGLEASRQFAPRQLAKNCRHRCVAAPSAACRTKP